jgi:hypothetical protein
MIEGIAEKEDFDLYLVWRIIVSSEFKKKKISFRLKIQRDLFKLKNYPFLGYGIIYSTWCDY